MIVVSYNIYISLIVPKGAPNNIGMIMSLFSLRNKAFAKKRKMQDVSRTAGLINRRSVSRNQLTPDFQNYSDSQIAKKRRQSVSLADMKFKEMDLREKQQEFNNQLALRGLTRQERRDAVGDARYEAGIARQDRRDAMADEFKREDLSYRRGRDAIGDEFKRQGIAREDRRYAISDARYKAGIAREDARNKSADELKRSGLALARDKFDYERDQDTQDRNLKIQQMGLAATQKQQEFNTKRIENINPGYTIGRANKLNVDTSSFYDDRGDLTPSGERFHESVKGNMLRGMDEDEAVRTATAETLREEQRSLSSQLEEVKQLKATDGEINPESELGRLYGNEPIENIMSDLNEKIKSNSSQMSSLGTGVNDPYRKSVAEKASGIINEADQIASNIETLGGDPVRLAKQAREVKKYLDDPENKLNLDSFDTDIYPSDTKEIKDKKEKIKKLKDILKNDDPKVIELGQKIQDLKILLNSDLTPEAPTLQNFDRGLSRDRTVPFESLGGRGLQSSINYALSSKEEKKKLFDESNKRKLEAAKKELEEYLKSKKGQ